MLEELKQMNSELEELRVKHLEKSKQIFSEVCKKVFEKHPKLESFGWEQYTPYFNDGDECVFRVHRDEPNINGQSGYELDFIDEMNTEYGNYDKATNSYPNKKETPNPNYNKELSDAYEDVKEFLETIEKDVFRNLFGDHVEVIVTREGVNVSEYDHD
jgi:NAD+--asparagine ADP-ribosyltransferase